MIESSGSVKQHQTYTHNHEVTDCIHATRNEEKSSAGEMLKAGEIKSGMNGEVKEQRTFSLGNFLSASIHKLRDKAIGFWNDEGNGNKNEKIPGETGDIKVSAEALVSAVTVKEDMKKESSAMEEETERKVGGVEEAISGGLEKEQGSIGKFFQNLNKTIAKAGKIFKKQKEVQAPSEDVPVIPGSSSFLMDSYSKTGQYSTLAKDRSMEGNFRAKG